MIQKRPICVLRLAAATILVAARASGQSPEYVATELSAYPGSPPNHPGYFPVAIGPHGTAVGWNNDRAVWWTPDGTTSLPAGGGGHDVAQGMNGLGVVVGYSNFGGFISHAAMWSGGSPVDLGTLGGYLSAALAVNANGVVVGTASPASGGRHAFIWQNGVMSDIAPGLGQSSLASAINDAGVVVGTAGDDSNHIQSFMWRNGVLTELGAPPSLPSAGQVIASDINNQGVIALTVPDPLSSISAGRAFLLSNGLWTDLGLLNGEGLRIDALNNFGVAVGGTDDGHGFIYRDGAAVSFDNIGVEGLQGRITDAIDINDEGQILAEAWTYGPTFSEQRFYVLSPVPAPGSVMLLLLGVAALRRRRPNA